MSYEQVDDRIVVCTGQIDARLPEFGLAGAHDVARRKTEFREHGPKRIAVERGLQVFDDLGFETTLLEKRERGA
jgi:hypothetical protein